VEEVVLYPVGTLDPRLVTAEDLFTSFYAWNGLTVVLQGYPFSCYGDSTVTVSGTIEYSWTGRIEHVDGAVVPDTPAAVEMELSPYACDGVTPIAGESFNMAGLEGCELVNR